MLVKYLSTIKEYTILNYEVMLIDTLFQYLTESFNVVLNGDILRLIDFLITRVPYT